MQFTNRNLEVILGILNKTHKYSKENSKGTVNCSIILSKAQHNEVKSLINTIEGLLGKNNSVIDTEPTVQDWSSTVLGEIKYLRKELNNLKKKAPK